MEEEEALSLLLLSPLLISSSPSTYTYVLIYLLFPLPLSERHLPRHIPIPTPSKPRSFLASKDLLSLLLRLHRSRLSLKGQEGHRSQDREEGNLCWVLAADGGDSGWVGGGYGGEEGGRLAGRKGEFHTHLPLSLLSCCWRWDAKICGGTVGKPLALDEQFLGELGRGTEQRKDWKDDGAAR